nr:hypothetical protein [Achromobacter ruhlandii]
MSPDFGQQIGRPDAAGRGLLRWQRQDGQQALARAFQARFVRRLGGAAVVHRGGGVEPRGFRQACAGGIGLVAVGTGAHRPRLFPLRRRQRRVERFRNGVGAVAAVGQQG